MADPARAVLSALVARFGPGLVANAARCEALLQEACADNFSEERAALVAAIECGVTGDLLNGMSSSEPKGSLLDRLSLRLAAASGLTSFLARWSVERWAVALGVVPETDRLMVVRLEGIAELIDGAADHGVIAAAAVVRLVDEARRRGVDEADAGAFLSRYAARHGWRIAGTEEPPQEPPLQTVIEPKVPPVSEAEEAQHPQPVATGPWAPRPRAISKPHRRVLGVGFGLVAVAAIAGVAFRTHAVRPRSTVEAPAQTSTEAGTRAEDEARRRKIEDDRKQQTELADREGQTYNAARGNAGALQSYLDHCRLCTFAIEARDEIHKLQAAALDERERQEYYLARGNTVSLQRYIDGCSLCVFATEARGEIRRLNAADNDKRAYERARGNVDALRRYAAGCDVCAFKSAALDEIAKASAAEISPRLGAPAATPRFNVHENYDLPGNDLTRIEPGKSTQEACATACGKSPDCEAYTYDRWNKACYLKNSIGTLVLNPKAVTGVRPDLPSPILSQAAIRLDRYRRKKFLDDPDRRFSGSSLDSCEESCRSDESCMAYTFLISEQQCLLFSHPGEYFTDVDASSGVKIQQY